MAGRPPRSDERSLWRAAMRDVAPLGKRVLPEPEALPPAAPPPARKSSRAPSRPSGAKKLPDLAHDAAPGLDRRNAERLRRGEIEIEAHLDLHGMTQAEAHSALDDFLARSHHAGRRCVLVITGKGGLGRGGVLRAAVPRWLNEAPNRARLLAFAAAQPKHGGAGALYLLLKRRR